MNPSLKSLTRREFLVVAGCGCAGLVLAGSGCARVEEATAAAAAACPYGYRFDPYPGQCYRFIDSNGSGYCDFSEPLITTTTVTTAAQTGSGSALPAAATATEETRVILCDRGCSAPGRCGRFTDSDGSGICDLTEGVVISVSTAATTTTVATATPATTATAASATAATTGSTTTGAAPAATATPAATAAAASVALVVLCDRGCHYPGSCGRYTDNDGTGVCDLSEGIPADQAAAYGGANSRGRGGRGG